jgi:hypothetical protein
VKHATILGLLVVAASAACQPLTVFYEVTRTPTQECEIFPNDRFCDELTPPVVETWTVEIREPQTFVYETGEVLIADGFEGSRDALKRSIITRDPGPCTTTSERHLVFDEDGLTFTGTLEVVNRIEGPAECGDTPRGDSHVYDLVGTEKQTP